MTGSIEGFHDNCLLGVQAYAEKVCFAKHQPGATRQNISNLSFDQPCREQIIWEILGYLAYGAAVTPISLECDSLAMTTTFPYIVTVHPIC